MMGWATSGKLRDGIWALDGVWDDPRFEKRAPITVNQVDGPTVSSVELCRQAGITYRQCDYWARQGLLVTANRASGSGTVRRYRPVEITVATTMNKLGELGVRDFHAHIGDTIRAAPPGYDWLIVTTNQSWVQERPVDLSDTAIVIHCERPPDVTVEVER